MIVLVATALVSGAGLLLSGCERNAERTSAEAERVATRHAEVRAEYLGQVVLINARDMAQLHPNSDRQRQAREKLLYLQRLQRQSGEEDQR